MESIFLFKGFRALSGLLKMNPETRSYLQIAPFHHLFELFLQLTLFVAIAEDPREDDQKDQGCQASGGQNLELAVLSEVIDVGVAKVFGLADVVLRAAVGGAF